MVSSFVKPGRVESTDAASARASRSRCRRPGMAGLLNLPLHRADHRLEYKAITPPGWDPWRSLCQPTRLELATQHPRAPPEVLRGPR